VALAAMTGTLRLWRADLTVPMNYSGDNLMNQMFIKTILESGWSLDNDRLGAPAALNMRDYPIPDVLHLGLIKLLGYLFHDSALILNLYLLLPFPLIALSAYFVLRRLKLGRLAALAPAVLYTSLPYHFFRIQGHLFLSAYYLLPLMIWVALRLSLGKLPFLQADPESGKSRWRFLTWEAAGAVLICLLTGLAGVYYAFFSCFLVFAAGVKTAFRDRQWVPLGVSAVLILLITAALGAALAPSFQFWKYAGKNAEAANRFPAEADLYALNISDLLLPVYGHRLSLFENIRQHFEAPPRHDGEGGRITALGIVGSAGFCYLMGRFLWRRRANVERAEDGLAYLNLAAVLLGTFGGFGALFNFYVTPMIRCYDRITIFIAFFALAGLFLAVQRLAAPYLRSAWARVAYAVGLGAVMVLGVWDQTSQNFIPHYQETKRQYASDVDFGKRIEAMIPAGSMIYEMPYMPFPEYDPIQNLGDYELLRPYLHTRTPRWSYGTMKGRLASRWQAALAERPPPKKVEQLAFAGFNGVYLDRAGYADNGAAVEAELSRLLRTEPLVSGTGRQTFFDLSAYVRDLHTRFSDAEWDVERDYVLNPVSFDWVGSFSGLERSPGEGSWRWCGTEGRLLISNPCGRPRKMVLKMEVCGWNDAPARLTISGDLCQKELQLTAVRQRLDVELLAPPGDHCLSFACDGPIMPAPTDPRKLVFRVRDFEYSIEGE
jgi:phosphoglycerol transferase